MVDRTVHSAREGIGSDSTDPSFVIRREAQLLISYADSPIVGPDGGGRAPDGTWTFITDRRPEHTCARYFAPGDSALTLYADIASKWDGPHSSRVTVPDMLDWRIELGSTPATVMMTAWHTGSPQSLCELAKSTPTHLLASSETVQNASEGESDHWTFGDTVTLRGHDEPTRLALPV